MTRYEDAWRQSGTGIGVHVQIVGYVCQHGDEFVLHVRELRVVMAGKLAQIGNVVKVILGPPKLSQHVGK